MKKAFRNIPGVSTINIRKLNLLKLAPGGHVGRFVIWTESAFKQLDQLYGTWLKKASLKKNYNLPYPVMTNTDLARLFKSEEIKKVLRNRRSVSAQYVKNIQASYFGIFVLVYTIYFSRRSVPRRTRKLNPLRHIRTMITLNPYAAVLKRRARRSVQKRALVKEAVALKKAGVRSYIMQYYFIYSYSVLKKCLTTFTLFFY